MGKQLNKSGSFVKKKSQAGSAWDGMEDPPGYVHTSRVAVDTEQLPGD